MTGRFTVPANRLGQFETTKVTATHIYRLTKGIDYSRQHLSCGSCSARTFWATAFDRVTGSLETYMAQSDRSVERHACEPEA